VSSEGQGEGAAGKGDDVIPSCCIMGVLCAVGRGLLHLEVEGKN
jgi:hypothetical protein